jgi:LysR family hydrogen peroxide-inducible transcriptional activator
MTLRELEYLVALAETRHFGRAAERCLVTQPTLSSQIQRLETSLGVRLFERTNRRLGITPVGAAIASEARRVLASVHAIETLAAGARNPLSARLALGIIPTLAPYLLPWFLPALQEKWPDLNLSVREDLTRVLLPAVEQQELDAAILAMPVHHESLHSEPLFVEPLHALLPREHPLAGEDEVSRAALAHEPLLLLDHGHCLREHALALCSGAGIVAHGGGDILRAANLETIRQMVASGLGVSVVPLLAARAGAADPRVVARPFSGAKPARRIALVWRKTSPRGELMHRLAAMLCDHLPAGLLRADDTGAARDRVARARAGVAPDQLPALAGAGGRALAVFTG